MWFLGAGASASAGIPTATDMIWEFKQRLFISQRRVAPQAVADLANPVVRDRLQAHIDSLGHLPSQGEPDEYAALFEAVYPVEADRRAYLDGKLLGAKPSYGHIALATMMKAGRVQLVWTTNFDSLVADACAKVYETTGWLTTGTLDAPDMAIQAIQEGRWPVEVKLHGDFRSRNLKNTSDELCQQDAKLRRMLVDSCKRFGLIVVGYSGRDHSVMNTLEEALKWPGAFPNGFYWLHRGGEEPFSRVSNLIAKALDAEIDCGIVQISNYDEVMRDLVRLADDLDTTVLDSMASERRVRSESPVPSGRHGWPVVRLNALQVTETPSICRRVVCKIAGTSEVREAVRQADANVIAVRSQVGVLAFGPDTDVRKAFHPFDIQEFDIHSFAPHRQKYDSTERGLLNDALTRAIEQQLFLKTIHRGRRSLLVPNNPQEQRWTSLKGIVGSLEGALSEQPDIRWREGIEICLDWADNRLWLLFEPRTVFNIRTVESRFASSSLARERTVKRYNRTVNQLFDFWDTYLSQNGGLLKAFTIDEGMNAVFRIAPVTGFSRRTGA